MVIYVVDKNAGGSHVSASELAAFLNAGAARSALTGAGCSSVAAVTRPTPQMLQHYLQTPPPGTDPVRVAPQLVLYSPRAESSSQH